MLLDEDRPCLDALRKQDDEHDAHRDRGLPQRIDVQQHGRRHLHQGQRQDDAQRNERNERAAVVFVVAPEPLEGLGAILLHHNGPQQRRHQQKQRHKRYQSAVESREQAADERHSEL